MDLTIAWRQLYLENKRKSATFQYAVPSPTTYPYQWFWDSCFHAIILSHFDTESGKSELLSLVSKQFDNGMIPHMIYWNKSKVKGFPKIKWGTSGTSSITQPPMIAYAVWKIYQKDKDLDFLKTIYPNLYHFYKYLLTERDPHENCLVGIMNPDESGEDNSPRFDIPLKLPPNHTLKTNSKRRFELVKQNIACQFDAPFCMRNFFWVKDVPFNSYLVENLRLLSKIATLLKNKEDADYFDKKRTDIIHGMRKLMLEDGIFWSTYGQDYKKIKVKTWGLFAPMFGNILTKKEAKDLVDNYLLNKDEFNANFLVPTVSLSEESFDPEGFWRGPVWIGTNWFVYQGLLNYGFDDLAKELKRSSIKLIQQEGFREYFNPITGKGLGAQNFTWGGLVLDM